MKRDFVTDLGAARRSVGLRVLLAFVGALGVPHLAAQPQVIEGFDGIRSGRSPGANSIPPDISGAVGRQGLLQVVNTSAAYYPRTGGIARGALWSIALEGANSAFPTSVDTFDPRAWYDPLTDRFFFIILDVVNAPSKKSWLHMAVSKTGHPQGLPGPTNVTWNVFDPSEWHRYRLDLTRTTGAYSAGSPGGADYPTLAVDGRSLYVTVNYFDIADAGGNRKFTGGIDEVGIFAFDKASLVAGTGAAADGSAPPALPPRTYFPSNGDGTAQPAMPGAPDPAPADAWFVSLDQDAVDTWIDTYYIGYPGGTGFTTDDDQTALDDLLVPGPAPQPGGARPLDTMGDRMLSAMRTSGSMIGVFVSEHDNEDRAVVRWVKMTPLPGTGATVMTAQGVLDAGPGKWNFMPAIGVNERGCLCVVWTACDDNSNPGIYFSIGLPGGGPAPAFSTPQLLLPSATPYNGAGRTSDSFARWGDYAHVSVDPVDGAFWVCQEYAASAALNDWGSWWAKISPDRLPVFTHQPYVTAPPNPAVQEGSLLPHPQTREIIRTIKVCQGQSLVLNVKVEGTGGQTAPFRWLKNGEEMPGSSNLAALPLNAVDLSHQATYQVVATSPCGVRVFSERIFLDVVVPPAATLNTATLYLKPRNSAYLEVTPDAAQVAEMDTLTFMWDRVGHHAFLGNRVQAFLFSLLQTAEDAAAVDGRYICTVANLCGAVHLRADVVAGPRILVAATAPVNAPAGGPPAILTVTATGVWGSGPPGHRRSDFRGFENYAWDNEATPGITSVTWRHRGMPIVPDERFAVATEPFAGTSALTIHQPDYENEGEYDCIVTDAWDEGRAVVSPATRLLLHPLSPPYLTVQRAGPDPRQGAGMVYDARRARTVLFGGMAFGTNPRSPAAPAGRYASNDTWEWDGQSWQQLHPANRPPPLSEFGMTYDTTRGRTVLFGGYEFQPPAFSEGTRALSRTVWEWDGEDWHKATPAMSPTARSIPRLVYDTARQETLLIGGGFFPQGTSDEYAERHQLWAWNGSFWTARPSLPSAGGTYLSWGNTFGFDEARGTAILFGPFGDSANPVWEWNGAAWTRVVPAGDFRVTDTGTGNGLAFYDPVRRLVGLPVIGNNFYPGYVFGTPFVAWWDGTRFLRGEASVLNEVDGQLPGTTDMIPYNHHGDLTVFDTARRCHVWLDMPQFANAGPADTRELHFSAKVKPVHLPREVVLVPGQPLRLPAISAGLRPLAYEWLKDGQPVRNDSRRTGADAPELVITNALAADAGVYRVRITNRLNQVTTGEILVGERPTHLLLSLAIGPVAGQPGLTLSWSGLGVVLEQAPTLNGPWTTVAGALSPYTPPVTGTARFFRLRT
jgi:hypothetical protein